MASVVPSKSTLDAWAQLGIPGWEWEAFSQSVAKAYSLTEASNVVQGNGPLRVTVPAEDSQWQWPRAWRDTLQALGHPTDLDAFSGQHYGGLMGADTLDPATKTRSYAADAYLGQAMSRDNLTVWTGVLVNKVVFSDGPDSGGNVRAIGVQYTTKSGDSGTVTANREIIITVGTIGSPKLLEISGVGDEELLKSHGIPIVISNSSVGKNLQNNPTCFLSFEVPPGGGAEGYGTLDSVRRKDPAALAAAIDAYSKGGGPLSRGGSNVAAKLAFPGINTVEGKSKLQNLLTDSVQNLGETENWPPKAPGGFDKALETCV